MSILSRRSLVTSAAALPALAVPAVAAAASSEPDPIFAAIEKERALNTAFLARCHYEDDLAETGVKLAPAWTYTSPAGRVNARTSNAPLNCSISRCSDSITR